jgi:hypothetical protein
VCGKLNPVPSDPWHRFEVTILFIVSKLLVIYWE